MDGSKIEFVFETLFTYNILSMILELIFYPWSYNLMVFQKKNKKTHKKNSNDVHDKIALKWVLNSKNELLNTWF